jgi:hypothetical protein
MQRPLPVTGIYHYIGQYQDGVRDHRSPEAGLIETFGLASIFLLRKRRPRNDSMAATGPIPPYHSVGPPAELKESD